MLLKILIFFFWIFCKSGHDVLSKQLKPSSLYKLIFCLPNFLVRKFKGKNQLIHTTQSRRNNHGHIKFTIVFFPYKLFLLKSKYLQACYIVFITFSSMVVTYGAYSMAMIEVLWIFMAKIQQYQILWIIFYSYFWLLQTIADLVSQHWFTCISSLILMLICSR